MMKLKRKCIKGFTSEKRGNSAKYCEYENPSLMQPVREQNTILFLDIIYQIAANSFIAPSHGPGSKYPTCIVAHSIKVLSCLNKGKNEHLHNVQIWPQKNYINRYNCIPCVKRAFVSFKTYKPIKCIKIPSLYAPALHVGALNVWPYSLLCSHFLKHGCCMCLYYNYILIYSQCISFF